MAKFRKIEPSVHGREERHAKTLQQGQVNPVDVEMDDVEIVGT